MKIEKLEWRNIFSYGNEPHEISFDETGKLWQISGRSGSGKSSFLSLPKLLFYGKCDGVKVGSIANRMNKNGWIRGTVRSGNDVYVIERKFSPNGICVWKNGEEIDRSGVKDVQQIIDTEILGGMPYHIYSNIVSLSLNNFKSFVSMSPADKRAIIDKIFSLEIINKVYELVKKDMRDLGNLINNHNSQIYSLNQTIKRSEDELNALKTSIDSSEGAKMIESIDAKINKVDELSAEQSSVYSEYYAKYNEIVIGERPLASTIGRLENDLSNAKNQLKLFSEDKCPTCGTPFSGSNFDFLRESLSSKITDTQKEIDDTNATLSSLKDAESQMAGYLNQINTNLGTLSAKRNELLIERRGIEAAMGSTMEFGSIQKIITDTKANCAQIEKDVEQSNGEMNLLKVMEELYSGDGIKQELMNAYIPALNEEIHETLTAINFPYTLEFDLNFDPHLAYFGDPIDVSTLSIGEHKMVDLTVLCSILRMMKKKYPQINLVCLDETLSSIDYETSADIITYLKDMAAEMKMHIFIVSHAMLDENLFDEKIFVEKVSGFTKFHYICSVNND